MPPIYPNGYADTLISGFHKKPFVPPPGGRILPSMRLTMVHTMPLDAIFITLASMSLLGGLTWAAPRVGHTLLLKGLQPERLPHQSTPEAHGIPPSHIERLRLPTTRQRHLHAMLLHPAHTASAPTPLVVALHGWGANAATLLPLARPLNDAGIALLLIDARCHGLSDDDEFTSLPRFAEDLEAALSWARCQTHIDAQRIALAGHSVGAGAALLVATRQADIRAVLSLSAFAHPAEVMRRWMAHHRVPARLVGAWVLNHVQSVIGARFDDIAPITSASRLRCPVLFVHGQDDLTVPASDASRLHQAAPSALASLRFIPGGHDLNQGLDTPEALEIQGFFRRAFEGTPTPHCPCPCTTGDNDVHPTPAAA